MQFLYFLYIHSPSCPPSFQTQDIFNSKFCIHLKSMQPKFTSNVIKGYCKSNLGWNDLRLLKRLDHFIRWTGVIYGRPINFVLVWSMRGWALVKTLKIPYYLLFLRLLLYKNSNGKLILSNLHLKQLAIFFISCCSTNWFQMAWKNKQINSEHSGFFFAFFFFYKAVEWSNDFLTSQTGVSNKGQFTRRTS